MRLVKDKNGGKFVQQLIYQSDEEKKNIPKIKTVYPVCQEHSGNFPMQRTFTPLIHAHAGCTQAKFTRTAKKRCSSFLVALLFATGDFEPSGCIPANAGLLDVTQKRRNEEA